MSSHDGIIELNREIARLESALASEREKVVALTDRVRGLEGALRLVASRSSGAPDIDAYAEIPWETLDAVEAILAFSGPKTYHKTAIERAAKDVIADIDHFGEFRHASVEALRSALTPPAPQQEKQP